MKSIKKAFAVFFFITLLFAMSTAANAASKQYRVIYAGKTANISGYTKVTTDNKKVLSVQKKGKAFKIKASKQGVATLKCYKGKKLKKTEAVLVLSSTPKYDTSNLSLQVGKTKSVKCSAYKCKVTYKSSNKKVATVNSSGKITGKKKGSCVISVTVKYGNKTLKTFKKKVTVTQKISKVTCSIAKKSVKTNQSYNKKDITVTVLYSDKTKKNVTDFTYSFIPRSTAGTATLTVKCEGRIFTYNISVTQDKVLAGINAACTKAEVEEGYKFSPTDFTVYSVYSDGSKARCYNYSISTSYASKDSYYTVSVTSNGKSAVLRVPVKKSSENNGGSSHGKVLTEIEATCTKSEVEEGYKFATSDFTVYSIYSDGSKERCYSYAISASNASQDSYYNVTVSSNGKSTVVQVKVKKNSGTEQPSVTLTGIEAKCLKTEVDEDYDFSLSDFDVTWVYSDGSKKKATSYGYRGTAESDGYYHLTVESAGFTKTLTVKIIQKPAEPTVTNVKFILKNDSVGVNQPLTKDQIQVIVTYSNGFSKEVSDYTHNFTPKSVPGTYPVIISWNDRSGNINVRVVSDAPTIKTVDINYAKQYLWLGEEPKKEDIIVKAVYSDGSIKDMTDFTFTFKPAAHGEKALIVVSVLGQNATLNVPVYDKTIPQAVKMSVSKIYYKVGEQIDKSTIVLDATYRDGSTGRITDFSIDYTPQSAPGKYNVKVHCKGFDFDYDVYVTE